MNAIMVYLAAPYAEAPRVEEFSEEIRAIGGIEVTSTWHREAVLHGYTVDPKDPGVRRRALDRNLGEMKRAQVLIALTGLGSPRGTYAEIGLAIGLGMDIIWVQRKDGGGGNIFDAAICCQIVHSREEALEELRRRLPAREVG